MWKDIFITCNQEGDKQNEVGDHLQGDHPQGLLQNRVVGLLVGLRCFLPFWIQVNVEVLVYVRDIEGLDHMSDLVEPAGLLEVAAHDHLDGEDGDGVEEEETEEDEERRLEGDQVVVCRLVFLFTVHEVNSVSVPIRSAATKVLQEFRIQLKFFSVPMGHAVSEPKEGSEECNDTNDPGYREKESSKSENHLGNA